MKLQYIAMVGVVALSLLSGFLFGFREIWWMIVIFVVLIVAAIVLTNITTRNK